jgi:predicted phosphodiesterase
MSIIFIGDVHKDWAVVERGIAAQPRPPEAVVLLGDLQCESPLDEHVAPLLDQGIAVHWIFGNHDNDGGPGMWANMADPERNPRTTEGALHARVQTIAGLRIAGLGGTFRHRIWGPPDQPRLRARAHLMDDLATLGPQWRQEQLDALHHSLSTSAIWHEDVAALAGQQADILVTHEAPHSHPDGAEPLEALARAMGAKLIVHGHHHVNYRAVAEDGLRAMGVGAAWGVDLHGTPLWEGDKLRRLGQPRPGWRLEA